MNVEEMQKRFPTLSRREILVGRDLIEHLSNKDVEILHFGGYPSDEPCNADYTWEIDQGRIKNEDAPKHFHGVSWDLVVASKTPLFEVEAMNEFLYSLVPKNYKIRDFPQDKFRIYGRDSKNMHVSGGELYISKEIAKFSLNKKIEVSDENMARMFKVNSPINISNNNEAIYNEYRIFAHPDAEYARENNMYSAGGMMGTCFDLVEKAFKTKAYYKKLEEKNKIFSRIKEAFQKA